MTGITRRQAAEALGALFGTQFRYLVCGNYTAFYRAEPDAVYVVRILYGRRDFMRILFGEPTEEN